MVFEVERRRERRGRQQGGRRRKVERAAGMWVVMVVPPEEVGGGGGAAVEHERGGGRVVGHAGPGAVGARAAADQGASAESSATRARGPRYRRHLTRSQGHQFHHALRSLTICTQNKQTKKKA